MDPNILYQDLQIQVAYPLDNGRIIRNEGHELVFRNSHKSYSLQSGDLSVLARNGLEDALRKIDFGIIRELRENSIPTEVAGMALSQAYIREKEIYEECLRV